MGRSNPNAASALLVAGALSGFGCGGKVTSSSDHVGAPRDLAIAKVGDLFGDVGKIRAARVVARSDGFDLLGTRSDSPWGIVARRASPVRSPLSLSMTGAAGQVVPSDLDGFEAESAGDLLTICHNHANADPIEFASFTAAYVPAASTTLFGGGASCNGIAFLGNRGLVAVNKIPNDGKCCSRPIVAPVSTSGEIVGTERVALSDSDYNDVALAAYGNGFVWAGFVQAPAVLVRLSADGSTDTAAVQLPVSAVSDLRPRVSAWPFDSKSAAVSFVDGDDAHIGVMTEAGEVPIAVTISPPTGRRVSRPALAATSFGLVDAYAECPIDGKNGQIVVEFRGSDGALLVDSARVPAPCPTLVEAAAAASDLALFAWPDENDHWPGVLVQVPH